MSKQPMTWFRMYHEFLDDPKVQKLTHAEQRHFIMLMCARCRNGNETLHDEDAAFMLRIPIDEFLTVKQKFVSCNILCNGNHPKNWDKRQYASDSSTQRVRKFRNEKKRSRNVSETSPDTDTDTDTDTEKKRNKNERVVFSPPSPDEVSQYSQSIGYPMDGQAWCDSYTQKGWMVGKNKMKDWRSAVRNWKSQGWMPSKPKENRHEDNI